MQKEYKKDLQTEIIGKGMQVGPYTPEIQRVKRASEIASQVGIVQRLTVLIAQLIAQNASSVDGIIPILNAFTHSKNLTA